MMKAIVGIWCGSGSELLADIHGTPLLRLTASHIWGGFDKRFLLPWNPDLDHLEMEIKSWRQAVVIRCHPDKRVAMRDLVAKTYAEIGILIDGSCAVVDEAEIHLANRRTQGEWVRYKSPRILAHRAEEWLGFDDSDEWVTPMDPQALRQFYTPLDMYSEARIIKAKKALRDSRGPGS